MRLRSKKINIKKSKLLEKLLNYGAKVNNLGYPSQNSEKNKIKLGDK